MQGVTEYRFDAGASSDPDNDGLTYEWNFGDGGVSSGSASAVAHTYDGAGDFTVSLTVSDGQSQAVTTRRVSVNQDLGGVFAGTRVTADGGFRFDKTLTLRQNGATLGGSMDARVSGRAVGTFVLRALAGTITGSATNFVCPCDVEFSDRGYNFEGVVELGSSTIAGEYIVRLDSDVVRGRVTFVRQ